MIGTWLPCLKVIVLFSASIWGGGGGGGVITLNQWRLQEYRTVIGTIIIRFQLYEILIKFCIDYMYNHNTVLIRRGLCSFSIYISLAPTGEGEVTHIIHWGWKGTFGHLCACAARGKVIALSVSMSICLYTPHKPESYKELHVKSFHSLSKLSNKTTPWLQLAISCCGKYAGDNWESHYMRLSLDRVSRLLCRTRAPRREARRPRLPSHKVVRGNMYRKYLRSALTALSLRVL